MSAAGPIAAAGGVVWRGPQSAVELAVVHRPRYDDWSLPKGKLADGESELQAAVREVGEELGSTVAVSRRVGRVRYVVDSAPKTVTFWAMRHTGGSFTPNDEIDDVEWLTPAKARKRLSYEGERGIVADFAELPVPDSVVILVRHARAGKRREWAGDDDLRPLDEIGCAQAQHLAATLSCFAPDQVISAVPLRCVQTVEPLAKMLRIKLVVDPTFGDESYLRTRSLTHTALLALLSRPGRTSVVCSQGVTIPSLIDRLGPGVRHSDTRKGAAWVLSAVDGDVIAADYYEASPAR